MNEETKTEAKPKFHINLLYLGVREGKDVPRVHEWAEIEAIPNDGSPIPKDVKTRIYGAAKKKYNNVAAGASPGSIYKFEADPDSDRGSIYSHSASYQGQWKNKDDVARWQSESRAIDYAIDMKAKEKKDNRRRVDMESLQPICEAYFKLVGAQKTILLAEVIRFISTWNPSKATNHGHDD
ncbi:MAG: hypothetical protein HYX68_14075 [Planctomycetes bacterium]|nr:hypothetical protein [Planctomycetota bacterium]